MRRCAGCGRCAPQAELFRFAARDGALAAGRHESGRGAYTCRSVVCFDRAVERGTFARVLKQRVRVGPELRRLYTADTNG